MAEHTPGPWRELPCGGHAEIYGADHLFVASVAYAEGSRAVDEANARLIAAAPALLAALEHCLEVIGDIAAEQCEDGENVTYWNREDGYGYQAAVKAKAAIAHATTPAPPPAGEGAR